MGNLLTLLSVYGSIGAVIAIIADLDLKINKQDKRFTFAEIWACILAWPILVLIVVKGFICENFNL